MAFFVQPNCWRRNGEPYAPCFGSIKLVSFLISVLCVIMGKGSATQFLVLAQNPKFANEGPFERGNLYAMASWLKLFR